MAAVNEMLLEALDKGSEKVKGFSKSVPPIADDTTPAPFAFNIPFVVPAPPWFASIILPNQVPELMEPTVVIALEPMAGAAPMVL